MTYSAPLIQLAWSGGQEGDQLGHLLRAAGAASGIPPIERIVASRAA